MEKRNILFVIHQMNYGGVQKAALSALNAINYSENEVTLYVRKNRLQLLPQVNKNVSRIIVNQDATHYYRKPYMVYLLICKYLFKLLRRKNREEVTQKKIVKYLNDSQMNYEKSHYFNNGEEYDIAISYIQGYTSKFVADYIQAKKKIMFYHDSTDSVHEIHEKIMPLFDSIVGVNAGVQKVLEGLYPAFAHKMTFVENYVDADEVRKKSKDFLVDRSEGKTILCSCGRLTPVKGFDLAVEAAKILKDTNIEFFWYFVGDGPERTKLEQMIQAYGLDGNIQITGMQDNPYPYMEACDIYVQPSYEESFGLTIAEAKILNKAIVTTKTVGGLIQIQQEINGLLCDIESTSMAKAIIRYKNENELRNIIVDRLENSNYREEYKKVCLQWEDLLKE